MEKDDAKSIENALLTLLKLQPNLIKPMSPTKESGEALAEFCNGFMTRFEALQKDLLKT